MKQNTKILKALGLAIALFMSVPAFGQEVKTGLRLSPSGKRRTSVRFIKRDNSDSGKRGAGVRSIKQDNSVRAIGGGGDPRINKTRKDNPTDGIRRRMDRKKKLNSKDSGLIVK